ncbi:MAG: hypothetical protein HOO96_02335 [Polyangiaceae bacterium]|nr:hypothetical protein [Polyangiaceae bacterium]
MSFGRNPHVAKAEAEELKAATAKDAKAMELAWREAARQWERAADREKDGKRRTEYAAKAEAARANADGGEAPADTDESASEPAPPVDKLLVN